MEFKEHRVRVEGIVDYCCESVKSSRGREKILEDVENLVSKKDKRCQRVRAAQIFNDSIHHTIEVNSLEKAIINTPEFFRLNDIKQLGVKFHVYCGATHTRFQHSIGVCYLAAEFMDHLKKQEKDRETPQISEAEECTDRRMPQISEAEEYCVRIAGLCHDLGHGPFSHLFEEVIKAVCPKLEVSHEGLSKLMLKKLLVDNPVVLAAFAVHGLTKKNVQDIEAMIDPENLPKGYEKHEKKKFLYEIVANKESGMDVDKWDYFARDFLHLGVTNEFDWRRCMKMSSIVEVGKEYHIGFRDKEITNIYGMFRTRSILHLKALRHNTVQAIEMMLKDILTCVADVGMFDVFNGDPPLSLKKAIVRAASDKPADLRGYMALTDSILHFIMCAPGKQPAASGVPPDFDLKSKITDAQKLITRLQRRELYKCVDERTIPCEAYEKMKQLKVKIQEKYSSKGKWEVKEASTKLVCFKFASEKKLDPVEDIYFFPKRNESGSSVPTGSKVEDAKGTVKDASPLCKPEKLFEYRIRMFRKSGDMSDEDLKRKLEACYKEIEGLLSE